MKEVKVAFNLILSTVLLVLALLIETLAAFAPIAGVILLYRAGAMYGGPTLGWAAVASVIIFGKVEPLNATHVLLGKIYAHAIVRPRLRAAEKALIEKLQAAAAAAAAQSRVDEVELFDGLEDEDDMPTGDHAPVKQ